MKCSAHHMSFPVRDLAASKKFYGGFLGLEEIARPEVFSGFPGAWYEAGAAQVHLIQVEAEADVGTPPESINPMGRHCAFGVNNYSDALASAIAADLQVFETSEEMGQLWVKDPDGHVIELIAPSPLLDTD